MGQRAVSSQSRIVRGSNYPDFILASLKGSTKEVSFTVVPAGTHPSDSQEVNLSVLLTEVRVTRSGFEFTGICQNRQVTGNYDINPSNRPSTGKLNFA